MADEAPKLIANPGERKLGRLLALDVRPQKAGFVVLERMKLRDWGVKSYVGSRAGFETTVDQKINGLLNLHSPALVVILKRPLNSPAAADAVMTVISRVRIETNRRAIDMRTLSTSEVRRFFAQYDCRNKQQIASLIAEWFGELAWKLPAKRKTWQTERYSMTIFDAAAVAITLMGAGSK